MANIPLTSEEKSIAPLAIALIGLSLPIVVLLKLLPDERAFLFALATLLAVIARFSMPLVGRLVRDALTQESSAPKGQTDGLVASPTVTDNSIAGRFSLAKLVDFTVIMALAKSAVASLALLLSGILVAVLIEDTAQWGQFHPTITHALMWIDEAFLTTVFAGFVAGTIRAFWRS
jgi:hypothetical protein